MESKELGLRQSREWIGGYQGLEFEGKEIGIYLKNTSIYINGRISSDFYLQRGNYISYFFLLL